MRHPGSTTPYALGWLLTFGCLGVLANSAHSAAAAEADSVPAAASGLDLAALDRGVQPCDDFVAYACGGGSQAHPVPAGEVVASRAHEAELLAAVELRTMLERFGEESSRAIPVAKDSEAERRLIAERQSVAEDQKRLGDAQKRFGDNQQYLADDERQLAEQQSRLLEAEQRLAADERSFAAAQNKTGVAEQQLGDAYASCMDEPAIEAKGLQPLSLELQRIKALRSLAELPALVATLHRLGVPALFTIGVIPDPWRGATSMLRVSGARLGLADRDAYLASDPAAAEQRRLYLGHLSRLFVLLGDTGARAAEEAAAALEVETHLAQGSPTAAELRQPNVWLRRSARTDLVALAPAFDWNSYFGTLGTPPIEDLAAGPTELFRQIGALLAAPQGLEALKSYFRAQLILSSADLLPRAFASAILDPSGPPPAARWQRCVAAVAADLPAPLAYAWTQRPDSRAAHQHAEALFAAVERALASHLTTLSWLSETTKRQALLKVRAVRAMAGGPPQAPDTDGLRIERGEALANRQRAAAFALDRELSRVGRADELAWQLASTTTSVVTDPLRNALEIPAALLQTPFLDPRRDAAANYGVLGSLLGQALARTLEDPARRFDATGRLRDWWAPPDAAELDRQAACAAGATPNAAGLSAAAGVRAAYLAYHGEIVGKTAPPLDGFTAEQRFFLALAQSRCTAAPAAEERNVNSVLAELPEFGRAWSCPATSAMVHRSSCRLW